MKIPEGLSCPVTPEQAYFPHPVPSVPNNWEAHTFAVPEMPYQGDEGYLDERGHIIHSTQHPQHLPRLIVRRKPEPKDSSCPRCGSIVGLTIRLHRGAPPTIHCGSCDLQIKTVHNPEYPLADSPEPKPTPASCCRNIRNQGQRSHIDVVSPEHCPCTDRCCFCHYEEQLPSKPRRWVVEFPLDPTGDQRSQALGKVTVIREVKPITLEQVIDLCNWFDGGGSAGIVAGLRELGIEVED